MNKPKLILILILILLASNVFLGVNYFSARNNLKEAQAVANKSALNGKILDFTSMFIRDVLKADKEVSFETRLTLETNIRDLKDEKIMAQWQNFINSKTEETAQENVKKLLEILITRIKK